MTINTKTERTNGNPHYKHLGRLFVFLGALFILPGVVADGRSGLIAFGISLLVIGMAFYKKRYDSNDSDAQN